MYDVLFITIQFTCVKDQAEIGTTKQTEEGDTYSGTCRSGRRARIAVVCRIIISIQDIVLNSINQFMPVL